MIYSTEFPGNELVREDIEWLANNSIPSASFAEKTLLVTGATGLIGSLVIKSLLVCNVRHATSIKVFALVRSLEKARRVFGSFIDDPALSLLVGDVVDILPIDVPIDYIIHAASVTSSRDFVAHPVETIITSLWGTRNMLELAHLRRAKGFVYLSSMEVFGKTDRTLESIKESDYGYIDMLDARSSYSESKRISECLCASYAKEYGLPAKIARLTQTLGPGFDPEDSRVAGYFARCVVRGEDIIMRTEGWMTRSCLYTRDAVDAIFRILISGEPGEAYSVANRDTAVPIREIAEMVASRIAGGQIKVLYKVDIPQEYAANQDLKLVINTDKLEKLGWKPLVGLEEAYRRLIEGMRLDLEAQTE